MPLNKNMKSWGRIGLCFYCKCSRAFLFYIESMERLYGLVFAAKRMVKVMPL